MGKVRDMLRALKCALWNYRVDTNQLLFIDSLKKAGVTIGENVLFVKPSSSSIDMTMPFLISIGNNVCISKGFSLFTHDYSCFISRKINGEIIGGAAPVKIGSNIQIGANVMILMGTTIENNVIVAAGAVCKGVLKSGYVYGGVPAKKLFTVDELFEKRRKQQYIEAKEIVLEYYRQNGRIPKKELFNSIHYFHLFDCLEMWPKEFWDGFGQKNNKETIKSYYLTKKPMFSSYEAFINSFKDEILRIKK